MRRSNAKGLLVRGEVGKPEPPPALIAFLVGERLTGSRPHGIVMLNGKDCLCRCGLRTPTWASVLDHYYSDPIKQYRWEPQINWSTTKNGVTTSGRI